MTFSFPTRRVDKTPVANPISINGILRLKKASKTTSHHFKNSDLENDYVHKPKKFKKMV